jgi:hypothetical protein
LNFLNFLESTVDGVELEDSSGSEGIDAGSEGIAAVVMGIAEVVIAAVGNLGGGK